MNQIVPAIPVIAAVFILACAYSAQYWAKKCHDELKAIRTELQKRS